MNYLILAFKKNDTHKLLDGNTSPSALNKVEKALYREKQIEGATIGSLPTVEHSAIQKSEGLSPNGKNVIGVKIPFKDNPIDILMDTTSWLSVSEKFLISLTSNMPDNCQDFGVYSFRTFDNDIRLHLLDYKPAGMVDVKDMVVDDTNCDLLAMVIKSHFICVGLFNGLELLNIEFKLEGEFTAAMKNMSEIESC